MKTVTCKVGSSFGIQNLIGRRLCFLTFKMCFFWLIAGICYADEKPPFTDYCQRLEQEIQGRKHGFLAGNKTYYVGGFHASWNLIENETIGLTHPFHHDLRSRGVGRVSSKINGTENTGVGNDFNGWEFYKDTRVLYGSVLVDGKTFENPVPKRMRWRPDKLICEYEIGGVSIREVKFIAENDAAASIITSSKPIVLQFHGQSFFHRNSVKSTATIKVDKPSNSILITEGGTVKSRPDPGGEEVLGRSVYSGMTTVLSSSRKFTKQVEITKDKRGVQEYRFSVECNQAGTIVSWAMHDDEATAQKSARHVIAKHQALLLAKTNEMNRQLNDEIPWFRCPDEKIVDIYYYLWSLYLMYYIEVGEGWEQEHHTQTAVNNFLGMHRYDAAFQIKVGAWTTNKKRYAYGNVLTWKHLTKNNRFRELADGLRMLSDNKGISWHSGAYGVETSEHVLGAWQIYQHTGDIDFLRECYNDHFAKLFEKRLPSFAMNQFEVAQTLEKMAVLTGNEKDVDRWQRLAPRNPKEIRRMFDQRWEMNGIKNYFAGPKDGMLMTNGFWAMRSPYFPNEYAKPMVDQWATNSKAGFYGDFFPLAMSKQSMKKFHTKVDNAFGYTPDTAYFMLDGMFRQGLKRDASRLALNHLLNYNYHEVWKIPMAPEAYRRDGSLFGDQFSNFNAGKILLILEGLGGLNYSLPDKKMMIQPALPDSWDWMEIRFPVANQWVKIRYTKEEFQISGNPFSASNKEKR